MSENKRYYWLKMPEDFFKSLRIKKLRRLAGGDTYTIIYLKIQLLSLNSEGVLAYRGIEKSFEEEIALEIDEDVENVIVTMNYLRSCGLLEVIDENHQILPWVIENTGSETASTIRSRKSRAVETALQCNTVATLPQHQCNGEIRDKREEIEYSSISDEIDYCTDVQRIVESWNAIGLQKIVRMDTESKRGQMLRKRIKDYGIDQILTAIESIPESDFLMGRSKKQFKLTFDWFIRPNNFPKVLEGNYRNGPKTVYEPDAEPYRGARYLAKLLRRRMPTLPEYQENTLQKWAAALDELHSEGHEWDEISDVMNLSQKSEFWQRQICDAYALKRKYVNLLADLERG